MAKEGKVLEQKKPLEPLLGTPEGIYSGCIIIFSKSAPSAVHPSVHADGRVKRIAAKIARPVSLLHFTSSYCISNYYIIELYIVKNSVQNCTSCLTCEVHMASIVISQKT